MANQFYFAYGSNLNLADWHGWCEERGYPRDLLKPVQTAVLPDHELSFSHYSTTRRGGALNVVEAIGKGIEGVVFEVTDPDGWEALDKKEGAPFCYQRQPVHLLDDWGGQFEATTYLLPAERVRPHEEPTAEYVDAVASGLRDFDLDDQALRAAAVNREAPFLTDGVFCYGTLMRFESRFDCLKEFQIECALLASTPGRLVDLGVYPGMLEAVDADEDVAGEFFRVRDLAGALSTLDRIEGFRGFDTGDSLFARRLVQVHVGEGRLRCAWVYVFLGPEGSAIESGCWRNQQGVRDSSLDRIVRAHRSRCPQLPHRLVERYSVHGEVDSHFPRRISELAPALHDGVVSERRMAQMSRLWTACC